MSLAIGASIALVGQTYHIPGDPGAFLLTWMLLALPLVYLLEASAPAILYLAGLTSWAGYVQDVGGHAVAFWPLAALVLPHVWQSARRGRHTPRFVVLGWALSLCLCTATGITLERSLPGLWIIVYAALLATLLLAGRSRHGRETSLLFQPFFATGALGIPVLALILSWEWPWQEIGPSYYRTAPGFHPGAAWFDQVAAIVLFAVAVALAVRAMRRRQALAALYGALPIVTAAAYATAVRGGTMPAVLLSQRLSSWRWESAP